MTNRKLILLTGEPGVGKTTLLQRILSGLRSTRVKAGGILTREVRENGERVGFRIMDMGSGREGWLATVKPGSGPRVGKYTVHTDDLDNIGSRALESALNDDSIELIFIDELGPMEMTSPRFRQVVETLLKQSSKPVIASYKLHSHFPIVENALKATSTLHLEVKIDNREILVSEITSRLDEWLRKGTLE